MGAFFFPSFVFCLSMLMGLLVVPSPVHWIRGAPGREVVLQYLQDET
jgi:hypothetical protein